MEKQSYSFTIINIILVVLGAAIITLNAPGLPEDAYEFREAYVSGHIIGGTLALILIPTLLSWIVWRISKRSSLAKSITFNSIIGLLILGQIGALALSHSQPEPQPGPIDDALDELVEHMGDIQDSELRSETADEFAELAGDIRNVVQESAAAVDTPSLKNLQNVLAQIMQESTQRDKKWGEAYETFARTEYFDFEALQDEEALESVIKIVRDYEYHSTTVHENLAAIPEQFDALAADAQVDAIDVAAAKLSFMRSYNATSPISIEIFQLHEDYAAKILTPLTFLKDHKNKWTFNTTEEYLEFESNDREDEFWNLIDELVAFKEDFTEKLPVLQQALLKAAQDAVDKISGTQ